MAKAVSMRVPACTIPCAIGVEQFAQTPRGTPIIIPFSELIKWYRDDVIGGISRSKVKKAAANISPNVMPFQFV